MRYYCVLALIVATGCASQPKREAIPYRFRRSLLDADGAGASPGFAASERPTRARPRRRARPAPRCTGLRGRHFQGPRSEAIQALVLACTGREIPPRALQGRTRPRRRGPRTGDVVLFHNTRDANRNHRTDDRYTDAGVVVAVNGPRVRFLYLHPRSARARLGWLNLAQPHRRRLDDSAIQNTFLRIKRPSDPRDTRYLAGQLVAGFITPHRARRAGL